MGSSFDGRCNECDYSITVMIGGRYQVFFCPVCRSIANSERYCFRVDYPLCCGRSFRLADRVNVFEKSRCPACDIDALEFRVNQSIRDARILQLPRVGQLIHVVGDQRGRPTAVGLYQKVQLKDREQYLFDGATVLECKTLEIDRFRVRVEAMRQRTLSEFSGYLE